MWDRRLGYLLLISALFLIFINLGLVFNRYSVFKQAFVEICGMVKAKIYLPTKTVLPWYESCLNATNELSFLISKPRLVSQIRQNLSSLEISHLNLNDPIEQKLMWSGLQKETGIRARNINDRFFVIEVKRESPAYDEGLLYGDEILSINGNPNLNYQKIKYSSGQFEVRRGQSQWAVTLEAREVKTDQVPYILKLKEDLALVRISSFRSEFFKQEKWRQTVKEMKHYKGLVIDLRDNYGGNFVAMLRALSPFFCNQEYLGSVGEENPSKGVPLIDDLSDEVQYDLIEKNSRVALYSYSSYDCYSLPVFVLINENTASVAEIFAHVMQQKERARLIGMNTSGQVLLAVWYNMPLLGNGYTLSIPEANYFDVNEESIEGFGIYPDYKVDYTEVDIKQGKDSFIEEAYYHLLHTSKK